ncbi:hypothetical protein EUX98_g4436 [Antrodiella citrinella]|uniref:Uncharacterized protein n=1 Tax=Antrodiella citrinella TaxID=2447956 RepID=A0A4S4MWG7_9APHY|nr:hypothetical protein EUX98_g4436 [Antrodiella citrinella]
MNAYKCFSYRPLIHTPLIVRVFRDGTLYYLLMCFVLVMRIVSQFHSGALGVNGDIVDTWMTTTFSIAGANLLLSIRKLSAEREERHLATPEFSCAIPQFASHPAVVTATSHHNYDSLSSRTCKVDLPSDSDYEMQSLAHHTHTESSFRGLVSSDKGPPKLSLDLRSSYQHSPDSERAPSLAAGEVPPVPPSAPERKASVKSSRSSRDPDYGWLQGWEAKL